MPQLMASRGRALDADQETTFQIVSDLLSFWATHRPPVSESESTA